MVDIVLFGAGQFVDVIATYLDCHTEDRIVGYTVDKAYRQSDVYRGQPLVDWETLEEQFPPSQVKLFGPVSYRWANRFRRDRFIEGKERGYLFYTFIHPSAYIYTEEIGENTLILEGNTVQPYASVGENCILWSHNHIGHHTSVGSHCFLASHVGIGGNTKIDEGVFFAGKSGAIDNLHIGAWSFFSPGAIAMLDVAPDTVVAAPPVRMSEGAAKHYAKRFR